MTKKLDIINDSYSQLKISGLTVVATPDDNAIALIRLEDMAHELERARNICMGYNFEEKPLLASDTNVERVFSQMLKTNLAMRMAPNFGVTAQQLTVLQTNASSSMSTASSLSASENVREVLPSRRQAIGSGNSYRRLQWNRYYLPERRPPNDCETNKIIIGDIDDYQESYVSYLRSPDVISSFVITADNGLTIITSSKDDDTIFYRIRADDNSSQDSGVWQQVKIVVTTVSGRISTRLINFEVNSEPEVNP